MPSPTPYAPPIDLRILKHQGPTCFSFPDPFFFAQKRSDLLQKLKAHSNCLRGSITHVCVTCNRANCICAQKSLRRAYRLTYKDREQKTKTLYIARGQLGEVRKWSSIISEYEKSQNN